MENNDIAEPCVLINDEPVLLNENKNNEFENNEVENLTNLTKICDYDDQINHTPPSIVNPDDLTNDQNIINNEIIKSNHVTFGPISIAEDTISEYIDNDYNIENVENLKNLENINNMNKQQDTLISESNNPSNNPSDNASKSSKRWDWKSVTMLSLVAGTIGIGIVALKVYYFDKAEFTVSFAKKIKN